MKTITFSAIKGGVGKSSLAILTANILSSAGSKVLCIDADPQNSMTFYYKPDNLDMKESLSKILNGGLVEDNIMEISETLSIVPSSLELLTCDPEPAALASALESVRRGYDYCVVDTAPSFDSVTINALVAADVVITPVQFSTFDYKSAAFYKGLLEDLGILEKWRVVFNRFRPIKTGGSLAAEYLALYNNTFGNIILKSRIPESAAIRQYFDTGSRITKAKSKIHVFDALTSMVSELTKNDILAKAI